MRSTKSSRSEKHVGTSKIADNSGEFSGPSLGGGGSVTSSRADRLEAERLKRKTQRELEIEKQRIEIDRQLAQDEREQRRIDIEASSRKQRLEAEVEDSMRMIEIEETRLNGSRSRALIRSVQSEMDMQSKDMKT